VREDGPETDAAAAGEYPKPAGLMAGTFGSLSVPNFRFLFGGTLAASFAMWMEQIGQGWLVAELTDSPFQLGLVQFIRGLSYVAVSPFVGWFCERTDRRWLAGAASMINGLSALAIALLIVADQVAMWQLYIAAGIGGLSASVYTPVRQFLVYDSVSAGQLPNAIALNSMANNVARVIGPGVAGFLISFSISSAFFGKFIFFTVATLSLIPMSLSQEVHPPRESMLASIRQGAAYLVRHRVLMRLTMLQLIPTVLVYPYLQLVPIMAKNYLHVGSAGYGWLQTGVGIGSVISALFVAYFADIRRKGAVSSVALVFYMSMILIFSFSRTYIFSLLLLVTGGLGLVVFTTFNQTLLQMHVDDEYRGRVLALYSLAQGLSPFGALAMGAVASEFLGTPHTIAAFVVVAMFLALLGGLASKDIRDL
jgi:MFS family permease